MYEPSSFRDFLPPSRRGLLQTVGVVSVEVVCTRCSAGVVRFWTCLIPSPFEHYGSQEASDTLLTSDVVETYCEIVFIVIDDDQGLVALVSFFSALKRRRL